MSLNKYILILGFVTLHFVSCGVGTAPKKSVFGSGISNISWKVSILDNKLKYSVFTYKFMHSGNYDKENNIYSFYHTHSKSKVVIDLKEGDQFWVDEKGEPSLIRNKFKLEDIRIIQNYRNTVLRKVKNKDHPKLNNLSDLRKLLQDIKDKKI